MKRPIRVSFFFDLCPCRRPWTHRHHVMTISVIITNCHKNTPHLMPDSWYTFGHRQEMKSAHLGQRACPCWATCVPKTEQKVSWNDTLVNEIQITPSEQTLSGLWGLAFRKVMSDCWGIASMEFYRTTLFSNAIPDKLPRGTEFLYYLFASFVILYYFCK